jgi:hypothetical protein
MMYLFSDDFFGQDFVFGILTTQTYFYKDLILANSEERRAVLSLKYNFLEEKAYHYFTLNETKIHCILS